MRRASIAVLAVLAIGGAQALHAELGRTTATNQSKLSAPSATAAPFFWLGYRELCADFYWTRGLAYAGGRHDTFDGLVKVAEASLGCDPYWVTVYDWIPRALEFSDEFDAEQSTPQKAFRRGVEFLEAGLQKRPKAWKLLVQAGQIYSIDLRSDDATEQAAWRDRGATLLERAVRVPGAPSHLATLAAHVRSQLGQQDRAKKNLEEMLALTTNPEERQRLAIKLAEITKTKPSEAIDYEFEVRNRQIATAWKASRPELPLTDALLLSEPRPRPANLDALAAGPTVTPAPEVVPLEPLTPAPPPADAPGSSSSASETQPALPAPEAGTSAQPNAAAAKGAAP